MAGRVVYDSDDQSDLSPPPSPGPATPARAATALMEPSPLPDTLSITHPVATSSTDPSFFQTVYEEQQRELGTQLGSERDLWDVPSSPMRPPPARQATQQQQQQQQLGDSAKRKRESDDARALEPKRQQRREQVARPVASSGLEISIPLEPLTPSMLHQYQQMLSSSSIDQSYPGDAAYTLGRPLPAYPPTTQPAGDAGTQSTVAFTTPSVYALSGRHALGSSSNANASADGGGTAVGLDRGVYSSLDAVDEVVTIDTSTPPRKARAAAVMSSPDIIAEPAPLREPQQPLVELVEASKETDNDVWEPPSTSGKPVGKPAFTQQQHTAHESIDELRIRSQQSARDEIDESDASELSFHSSPGRDSPVPPAPSATKTKLKQRGSPVVAASDDEGVGGGGGCRDEPDSPLSDMESDFSVKASKKNGKKGRKKKDDRVSTAAPPLQGNAIVHIELLDKAPVQQQQQQQPPQEEAQPKGKRPRGRPRQVAKQEYEDGAEHVASASGAEVGLPEASTTADDQAAPAAKPKGKGKKGRPKKADSKGKKNVDSVDSSRAAAATTALGETSGNAVSAAAQGEGNEGSPPAADVAAGAAAHVAAPAPVEAEKPVTPAAAKPAAPGPTAGLGVGLGSAGQARVLYRVGLSKKSRIAPLLKIVRK